MISFVGAGPGSADLLTMRAVRCLARADVVLYDALGCEEALAMCPQAKKIPVGKRAGAASCPQTRINAMLVELAANGQHVVRLKGGDPCVFGRLDEEIQAATRAGIAYEIIPGITAASALAAQAGVPLTRRGVARSLTLATPAVGRGETPNPDWVDAASTGATLAVYMAGKRLTRTALDLLAAGFAADTPVLMGYGVSTPQQSLHRACLGELASQAHRADCNSPCLLLVGPVLADQVSPAKPKTLTVTTACAA